MTDSIVLFGSFGSRKRRKKGPVPVDKKLQKKMKKLINVIIVYEDQVLSEFLAGRLNE
jgi:hypothetical protein